MNTQNNTKQAVTGVLIGFLFFLILILTTSCDPIRRHQRLVEKFPHVHTQDTVTLIDTFRIEIPKTEIDSVFLIKQLRDTITIEKERLRVQMYTIHDSIYIDAHCDTITVEKIIERKIPVVHYETKPDWIYWLKWVLIVIGAIVAYRLLKNPKQ
jgi:hypothetical protein